MLQIGSMQARSEKHPEQMPPESIPEIVGESAPTRITVRFTAASVRGVFDDLYTAKIVEEKVKSKWAGQTPKREEEVSEPDPQTGKLKKSKRYIYDVTRPLCPFLRDHYPEGETGAWHKLWRDMLWSIPRGNPQSREPFNLRATDKLTKEGMAIWNDLQKVAKARQQNRLHTTALAGSLWLGAQAMNAEQVPFEGRAEHNLLLHFWPLTVLVFVPQQLDREGATEFVGYSLAIPEVAHLGRFCRRYTRLLEQLDTTVRGYRPAAAIIDLPEESALHFLEHLAECAQHEVASQTDFSDAASSIEFFHMAKLGNNIKLMGAGCISPQQEQLEQYRAIVGPRGYRNPLFRRGLMLAVLREQPWQQPFAAILQQWPWPFFIRSEKSPNHLSWFWADAARKFDAVAQDYQHAMEVAMAESSAAKPKPDLALLVHQLVRNYVFRKLKDKTGMEPERFSKDESGKAMYPKEWNEEKEKVASAAFLLARSRREQDFVDFFTGTFCSYKQYLPEEQFQIVAHALLTEPENVKTLTLLALSANS